MGVLHLVDLCPPGRGRGELPTSDAQICAAAGVIAHTRAIGHTVCVLGGSWSERRAAACGLVTTDRIAPVLQEPPLAARTLRRFIADRTARPGAGFHVVQPWSERALRLAHAAVGPSARILDVPRVEAGSFTCAPREAQARSRARERLGLGESECVVLMLADPPHTGDSWLFQGIVGLLSVAGVETTALVPEGAARAGRAARLHARASHPARVAVSYDPLPGLLGACDVAVAAVNPATAERSRGGVALAMALGVPVVVPPSPTLAGLFDGAHATECVASSWTAPALCRVLMPLVLDAGRRDDLGRSLQQACARRDEGSAWHEMLERAWAGDERVPVAG